ncbi:MAG: ABC transporter permease [Candidatus Binatia bacterium]
MSWRRLLTLVRREVRATLRDPFTVSVLICVPLGALLVFGFILSVKVKHLPLAVLDGSRTPASRRLLAELGANGTFDVRPVDGRAALDRALVSGEANVALVIPPAFGRALAGRVPAEGAEVQAIYDAADAVLAANAETFLRAIVAANGASLVHSPGPAVAPGGGVRVRTRALFNPTLAGEPFMVSGTFGFVLSFLTTLITAVTIVNERLAGTFEQLQVTPATSAEILLGKILPMGAIFTADVALMVVVAGVVIRVWPHGSVPFFVAVSGFYVCISLALGLLISATSKTSNEAVQKTVMTSIPLVQLSGFAFPIRNMPHWLQWAVELFPATHYIRISRAIYLRGEGPLALWPELAVLLVMGVVLMGFALRSLGART